jgi:hypothetical protein
VSDMELVTKKSFYILRHKTTKLQLSGIRYEKIHTVPPGKKNKKWVSVLVPAWWNGVSPIKYDITEIEDLIYKMIERKFRDVLDECELERCEERITTTYTQVKTTTSCERIKERIEAKMIMQKLKAGI